MLVLVIAAVSACGTKNDNKAVSGTRGDVRHVPRQTVIDRRPAFLTQCTTRTKQVKHTSTSGSGATKKTRTWYTTEPYQDCKKVRRGTEPYVRVAQAERWCVQLDDVNGNTGRDHVWYEVESAVYEQAAATEVGSKMTLLPLRSGC
ncbi:hypothetical protein ACFW17_09860 [Streptomyces sp. NPDC058961]|uniref:hypothetical protein n=1 Tax=Streptomyces sp. NPDC058961 TaxID=3346680 RepID=UPI00367D8AC8